jgi:phage terminase small subunit
MSKLNERQKRFCDYYVIKPNGTEAAIKAGYSEKAARKIASKLLTLADIKDYIETKLVKRENKLEITAERVLLELARISFFDVRKLFNEDGTLKRIVDLDDDTAAAIAGIDISTLIKKQGEGATLEEITKKIKHVDKKGALELLGRNLSIWHDKLEVKNTTVPATIDISKLTPDDLVQLSNMMKKIMQPVNEGGLVRQDKESIFAAKTDTSK